MPAGGSESGDDDGTRLPDGDFNQVDFIRTFGGADASVTYTYTAVPEPGTLAMSAVVLLGALGVWRNRRKRKD